MIKVDCAKNFSLCFILGLKNYITFAAELVLYGLKGN